MNTPSTGSPRVWWQCFLPCLLLLLPLSSQALPWHYKVNVGLRDGTSSLELRCPVYHSTPGHQVIISDAHSGELLTRFTLQKDKPIPVFALSVEDLNADAGTFIFECKVLEAETQRLISKTTFILQRQAPGRHTSAPFETFHYEQTEEEVLRVRMGQRLHVMCPVKAEKTQWFRAAGEKILHSNSDDGIETLSIPSIMAGDLGVYYCGAESSQTDHHRASLALPVKKFIIMANKNIVSTQIVYKNVTSDKLAIHTCTLATENPNPTNVITWERPRGVVHLTYSGKPQIIQRASISSKQIFYCSVEGQIVQQAISAPDLPLVRSRRSISKPQFILREVGLDAKTANVECSWPGGGDIRFEWLENGEEVIGREARQELNLVGLRGQDAERSDSNGKHYTCRVFDANSGEQLGESFFNNEEELKPPNQNFVELREVPDNIYVVHSDEPLELHCNIPENESFTTRDIVWHIRGEAVGRLPNQIDAYKTSSLSYPKMSPENSGTYGCGFGDTLLSAHLIIRERSVSIDIQPKDDVKSSGINDVAEFHCRVSGIKDGGKHVHWSFIPEGSSDEEDVPWDTQIAKPDATPATTFLYIQNPDKRHAGQYICRIRQNRDIAKLKIEDRKITVIPESVTTRAGSTVRFFCSLTLQDGNPPSGGVTKVTWFRKDRHPLEPGREEIISGTTANNAAVLVIKNVDWTFNEMVYMCSDGFRNAEAKIMIQEVCNPNERSCGGDKCINEKLFCNGVADCPDGSDEIPERCRECEPNQYACLAVDGVEPKVFCYLRSWHCDGENDCGNNFDELNCPDENPNTPCSNRFFKCPDKISPIPRSYLCDGENDCGPPGIDEMECSKPSVIYPPRGNDVLGVQGTNVTLKCVVHGRPPPTIDWRFNWGPIRTDIPYVENTTIEGCDRVTSYLTLIDIDPRASGMYTCEANNNRNRILAPDYTVTVGVGTYCSPPAFNDAAWNKDMCLNCYCSGVSDSCKSLRGYSLAPFDKVAKPTISDVRLVQYDFEDKAIIGEPQGLQLTDSTFKVTVPDATKVYLEGTFGLAEDWTSSYSLFLKADVSLVGQSTGYNPNAAIVLEGNGEKIYYCTSPRMPALYTSERGYQNNLRVRLTERDGWTTGSADCERYSRPVTREQMMLLLSNVNKIRFRVDLYEKLQTYELENVRLETVEPSDAPGTLLPEIEYCACPEGYTGLSCQQCSKGYEHDPANPTNCRLPCACDSCDSEGNCIDCPGNSTGYNCRECKTGFYRPPDQSDSSSCLPCEKCGGDLPHVSKACVADPESPEGYRCRCVVREDERLLEEPCDLCKTAHPPPEAKCEQRTEVFNLCNIAGTESITVDETCKCKAGYEGESCQQCSEGFMKYGSMCLSCFCAGTTSSCSASSTHFFENVTLANPGRYRFDISLSRKLSNGEIVAVPADEPGKSRVERVYATWNKEKYGSPEDLLIREPLSNDGVSQISIKIRDSQLESTASDLPVYRYLYGGRMSFGFKRVHNAQSRYIGDDKQPIITIESPKFGTIWTTAVFNSENQRFEVVFSENWWNNGWRAQTEVVSRSTMLRVLGTASSIGISFVATNNGLENARISGLAFEIARDFADALDAVENLVSAPVEVCECASGEGRRLSPSCEGCRDLSMSTTVSLDLSGPDFQCGECRGPGCERCESGQFKYDFLTKKVYETCQPGVEVSTKGRVVMVESGSQVALTCRAVSKRGGLAIHTWRLPAHMANSSDVTITRELLPFEPAFENSSWRAIESETVLQIDNAKKEHSGIYECQVAALGANLTEPFHLIIRDLGEPYPSEPADQLNKNFPVPMALPSAPPRTDSFTVATDPEDQGVTVLEGKVSPATSLNDFHLVWLMSNGTQIIPLRDEIVDTTTGRFTIRLPVSLIEMDETGDSIRGYLVGKNPIKTPIWVPFPSPSRIRQPAESGDVQGIRLSHPNLKLSFLEPAKIRVLFDDKRPRNVQITWRRIGHATTEAKDQFPPGMGVTRDNDLVIWAAGEEHSGTYEVEVINPETGEVKRLNTTISVAPMLPAIKVPLDSGKSGESPEEAQHVNPPQPTAEDAFVYYVDGYTPEAFDCQTPSWMLIDEKLNSYKDISSRVIRVNEHKFIINYPLASGKRIKYQCLPIPNTNLSGSLHFDIDSPDTRVIFVQKYDDPYSVFPTRLICAEGNPNVQSTIKVSSDVASEDLIKTLESPVSRNLEYVELDWRRVGGFQASKHLGTYNCTANTPTSTVTKSLTIQPRIPPYTIEISPGSVQPALRIYSPDQVLVSDAADQYQLNMREGQQVRVIAEYDSQSITGEITWTLDDSNQFPQIISHGGHSWTSVNITQAPIALDGKVLHFIVNTPTGEKRAAVTLSVRPVDRSFVIVQLNSSSFINGDLVGLTGGDMSLNLSYVDFDGKTLPEDVNVMWRITRANGAPIKLEDRILSEQYYLPAPSYLELRGLPLQPTEFLISAAVIVPSGDTKEVFTSLPYRLIVREPLMIAYVHGLTEPGVLTGFELDSVGATCVANDVWFNQTVKTATYDWDYVIQPEDRVDELPTSANKIEPSASINTGSPWSVINVNDNALFLGQLKISPGWFAYLRCRAQSPTTGQAVVSEWFKLNVIPRNKLAQYPVIEIRPTFDEKISRFPIAVECLDTNTAISSIVTWSKEGGDLPATVKVDSADNAATLKWSLDASNQVSPHEMSGIYTCEAKNEFTTVREDLFLPNDLMDKYGKEKLPIDDESIRIRSPYAEIEETDGNKYLKVLDGGMLGLICEYVGYPPPVGGLKWRLQQGPGEGATGDALARVHGLAQNYDGSYWTTVESNAFNVNAPQTGVYACEAIDENGDSVASQSVTVEVLITNYSVKVLGLNKFGVLKLQPGGSGFVSCQVTDSVSGGLIRTTGRQREVKWEGPMVETENVKTLQDLARTVHATGGDLRFEGVKADLPDVMWGKCVFIDGNVRRESELFRIIAKGEGGTDGKIKVFVEDIGTGDLSKLKFRCDATDIDDHQPIRSAIFDWRFVTSSGSNVDLQYLFKNFKQDGNVIVLTEPRQDVDIAMLTSKDSAIVGRCVAFIPATKEYYWSQPFFTVNQTSGASEDDHPEIVIHGADNGEIPVEAGKDVRLRCLIDGLPQAHENISYHWLINGKDGRSVDTSVIADSVEVIAAPEGGLELKLTGLKASAVGLQAKCMIRNGTKSDGTTPNWIYFNDNRNVIRFSSDLITPDGNVYFGSTSYFDTVPLNDRRNKYVVHIDGLDESGRLAAPLGSNVSLSVKILDRITGEEVPFPGPSWNAAGLEVQRVDSVPVPLSFLANGVYVDSSTGVIQLTDYRGDTYAEKPGELQFRVVVERKLTDANSDWESMPGQISAPTVERFASSFAQIITSDQSSPDDPPKVEKLDRLVPVVHGLSECHSVVLKNGEDHSLVCKPRGIEQTGDFLFSWEFRTIFGESVPMTLIAGSIESADNTIHLKYMKELGSSSDKLLGRCVIVRKSGSPEKHYSREFLVGPMCSPSDMYKVRTEEYPFSDPSQRMFTCVATRTDNGHMIQNVTYDWEFTDSDGNFILPGHLFQKVDMHSNSILLGALRDDVDLSKYLGDHRDIGIEGRCVAILTLTEDGAEPIRVRSEPMIRIASDEEQPKPVYVNRDVFTEDKPSVHVSGGKNDVLLVKSDESVTLKCDGFDTQTGSFLDGLLYLWEIQTPDGRPVDSGPLAESIEVTPSGFELKLKHVRSMANGLRVRCVLANATLPSDTTPVDPSTKLIGPGDKIPGKFITLSIQEDPDREDPIFGGFGKFEAVPDSDKRKKFRVEVEGLGPDGNLVGTKGDNITMKAILIDMFTGEKAEALEGDEIVYGLEATNADGSSATLNTIAESLEINSKTGEIMLYGYRADQHGSKSRDLHLRTIALRTLYHPETKEAKHERYASPYFYPVLIQDDGTPLEDPRPMVPEFPELKPVLLGLSECGNLPVREGGQAALKCDISSSTEDADELLYGWDLWLPSGRKIPLTGFIAGFAKQAKNTIELIGLSQPNDRVFVRCVVARPSGDSSRYYSEYIPIGATCDPDNESRVKVQVVDIARHDPNEKAFECYAYDSVNGGIMDNATFRWRFLANDTGNIIPPSLIFSKVTMEGRRVTFVKPRMDVDFKALSGSDKLYGECVVEIPKAHGSEQSDSYPSGPKFFIQQVPSGVGIIEKVDQDIKKSLEVVMEGVKHGRVDVHEGDNYVVSCTIVDAASRQPQKDLLVNWVVEYLDGSASDTAVIAQNVESVPIPAGAALRLKAIQKSASMVRAKCLAFNGSMSPIEDVKSPYIGFDVTSTAHEPEPSYLPTIPKQPTEYPKDVKFVINGLNENGELIAQRGSSNVLTVKLIDVETGEDVSTRWNTRFGVEVQHADTTAVPLGSLADNVEMNSKSGELRMEGYRGDSLDRYADDLFLRFVVERLNPQKEDELQKFVSKAVPVKTLTEVDNRLHAMRLPDLKPIVLGLSKCGTVEFEEGDDVTLKCKAKGIPEDDDDLVYAWTVIRPGGGEVAIAGTLAKTVEQAGSKLRLIDMRIPNDQLYGRCIVARKAGNRALYGSYYFRIGGQCEPKTKTVLQVEKLPTSSIHERKYKCKSIRVDSGLPVHEGTFKWEFSTTTGEVILPSHVFSKVIIDADTIQLGRLKPDIDLTKFIGPNEGKVIVGRCRMSSTDDGDFNRLRTVSSSDPFIVIGSAKEGEHTGEPQIVDATEAEDEKPDVTVKGADMDRVTSVEGGSINLKCEAHDTFTKNLLDGVIRAWEVRTIDNRPVDTSALADSVVVLPSGEIQLRGLRRSASGLRARCVLFNGTFPSSSGSAGDEGVLPVGDVQAGEFMDFEIQPDDSKDHVEPPFSGMKAFDVDTADPPAFKVEVDGLDEHGTLSAKKDAEVVFRGKLIAETGEEESEGVRFGLEASYGDGIPAPLSLLGKSVSVDSNTGEITVHGFNGDLLAPQKTGLRIRIIAERTVEIGEPPQLSRNRYASDYIQMTVVDEGDSALEDNRPLPPKFNSVTPVVEGLSQCNNIVLNQRSSVSLYCKTAEKTEEPLVFGWELLSSNGVSLPLVGLVSSNALTEGSLLYLTHLVEPTSPVFGRCVASRRAGNNIRYYSSLFRVGGECDEVGVTEPLVTTTVPTGEDGGPNTPSSGIFTGEPSITTESIQFRLTGITSDRLVLKKPGENATIMCQAIDSTTDEEISDAVISWEFSDLERNEVSPMRIAGKVFTQGRNAITFVDLRNEPRISGRCLISLAGHDTIGTPSFYFHVVDDAEEPPLVDKIYDDQLSVKVLVSGLNEQGQISVKQIGDDVKLTCNAINASTGQDIIGETRYGWDWRYLDSDPAMTSNVAVGLKVHGSSMELLGVQASEGLEGRDIKARCVVHVLLKSANQDAVEEQRFTSPYFTVVVDRFTVPLPPPVLGHESDGITVEISGAANGELRAAEGANATLECRVTNTSTTMPVSAALYNIVTGWEFVDASGSAVDSSYFAKAVDIKSYGSLQLWGLSAPLSGRFPMRMQCFAKLTPRQLPGDKTDPEPPRLYKSDFIGLLISRQDGSETGPLPGQPEPDLQGDRVTVSISGLHPSGAMKKMPGESAVLECTATDTQTSQALAHEQVIYDWSLLKPNGQKLSNGLVADEVVYDGSRLILNHVKLIDPDLKGARGRCKVVYNGQTYMSPFFLLEHPDEHIEGDGTLIVNIHGVDKVHKVVKLSPGQRKELQCYAVDLRTMKPEKNILHTWEYHMRLGSRLPNVPNMMDSSRVEALIEGRNGSLILLAADNRNVEADKFAEVRCRVTKGERDHTSPFYAIRMDHEDLEIPDAVSVPRYWANVTGLDDNGRISANPEVDVTLGCMAIRTETGQKAEDVDYVWELRSLDGRMIDINQLASGRVIFNNSQMIIEAIQSQYGTTKGRCVIVDRQTMERFPSSDFIFFVPPSFDPDEQITKPQIPPDSHTLDTRVKVWVTELNALGNLNGIVGQDASLQCHAQLQASSANILDYSWEFIDEVGQLQSASLLANEVSTPDNGASIQLSSLRAHKTPRGYFAMRGRCFVSVAFDKINGSVEQLRFPSEYFAVVVRDSKPPVLPEIPKDMKGEFVIVEVDGLDDIGNLKAQPGEIVSLTCKATDVETSGAAEVMGEMSWSFIDSVGRKIPAEHLAMYAHQTGRNLVLGYLRPTTEDVIIRGRCIIFSDKWKHLYSSVPFQVIVKQKDPVTVPIDGDVVIEVGGDIADGMFTAEKGGEGTVSCSAIDAQTGETIPAERVLYAWEFEVNGENKALDAIAGEVAGKINQAIGSADSQATLHLQTLSSKSKWTRARCRATVFKPDELGELDASGRTYYSDFFSSGKVLDSSTLEGPVVTDQDVAIRVHGLEKDNLVVAHVGDDRMLKCSAIDLTTGEPIENPQFTWELRTIDDQPLATNKLADRVQTLKEEIRLFRLQQTSKFARLRCLLRLPPKKNGGEIQPMSELPFHASEIVRFNVTQGTDELEPSKPRFDITKLNVEVDGISQAGSLTGVAGSNRTLECIVTDKMTGAPAVEGISIGWILATGPDNQPVEVHRLAEEIEFNGAQLTLTGLQKTGKYSGGLRGRCVVTAIGEDDSTEGVVAKSDVFAIRISPKPSIGDEETTEPEKEQDKGLPDIWLPGPDPKNAVSVTVDGLNSDGSLDGHVGTNAVLVCIARETKTQQQLKVGEIDDKITPRFGWELRERTTGEELSFGELVSDKLTLVQTSPATDSPNSSAASRLNLQGMKSTVGRNLHGRCTVRLNGQLYQSAYFPILIGGMKVPGVVVSGDEIPEYYAPDGAVTVVVSGLEADGSKVVGEGDSTSLNCTAFDTKSRIPLSDKPVFYGWRLVNSEGHELLPEQIESANTEGNTLNLRNIFYAVGKMGTPEPIYGWCVVGLKQKGFNTLSRYRSAMFIIHPKYERPSQPEEQRKPDITVAVISIGGNEDFIVDPEEDIELEAAVTDTLTGDEISPENINLGWEWTDASGSRPASLSEFAEGGEELNNRGSYKAYRVQLTRIVRGRAVAVYTSPEDGQEWTYTSPYFFLSPSYQSSSSDDDDDDNKKLIEDIPVDEGKDGEVILEVSGLDANGLLIVPVNGNAEVTVTATSAKSKEPLTDKTEPALVGYSWEVIGSNSLQTHTSNIADSITMNKETGTLSLTGVKIANRQVMLQMVAMVDVKLGEKNVVRRRYKSDPIPLVLEGDNWPTVSNLDVKGKDVTVTIKGLDENDDLTVNAGETAELKAVAIENSGAAPAVKGYSWTFIDRKGYPVVPSLIAKSVEEDNDGGLTLSVIQPLAIADGVQGRCRVAVDREGSANRQYYESNWFHIKSPSADGQVPTDRPDISTEDGDHGFTLKIKSDSSAIYPSEDGQVVMSRSHLPFEVDCIAEFAEGVQPRLSESGKPIPQLVWFYRRPEIPGDVPIPAELYRVEPGKLETLVISEISDLAIRISSDYYDFHNNLAEFQCYAFDGNRLLAKEAVFINRVKERIRVQVFDENSRTALYALEESKSTLSCYVDDEVDGKRVDPRSYRWELSRPGGGWDGIRESTKLATTVAGVEDKDLVLDGLVVSEEDQLSSLYQVRCVAQHNDTYFTVSRGYPINVHKTPELKSIRLVREKPETLELIGEPTNDVYEASNEYLVSCKPEVSSGEVQTLWDKYDIDVETWQPIFPTSDQLFFVADSTEHQDEGLYRCRVSLSLQDYGYHVIKTRELNLSRIAGPAPSSNDQQTFTVNDELILQCPDTSASPQVDVEWSFVASGEGPPENKDPFKIGSYFKHERTNGLVIPRGQLLKSHSGTYTCTRKNAYGEATTSILVTVNDENFEQFIRKRT